jgi:hypothetical protein
MRNEWIRLNRWNEWKWVLNKQKKFLIYHKRQGCCQNNLYVYWLIERVFCLERTWLPRVWICSVCINLASITVFIFRVWVVLDVVKICTTPLEVFSEAYSFTKLSMDMLCLGFQGYRIFFESLIWLVNLGFLDSR